MSFAKVTYPPPPPTINSLTLQERNQFVRSNKKIGKVLGSTPHLVDVSRLKDPLHIDISVVPAYKPHLEIFDSPVSDHSHSSGRPRSSCSYSSMSSESTDSQSSHSPSQCVSSYTETINCADSWRVRKPIRKPPPLLRLITDTATRGPPSTTASVKPTLETIPASPPFETITRDKYSDPRRNSPRTISFAAFGPPKAPTFEIRSDATFRWAKMERLKRKLGDGVPAHLIFPSDGIETDIFDPVPTSRRSAASNSPPITSGFVETSSPKIQGHTQKFSLERPLFAIVEGPDDHISSCFEFGSRRDRVG